MQDIIKGLHIRQVEVVNSNELQLGQVLKEDSEQKDETEFAQELCACAN